MTTNEMVRDFLVETFLLTGNDVELQGDTSLLEEGIVDSTGVLDVILFVEQTFGISVADEDVVPDNFDSVNKIAAYVDRKRCAV